MSDCVAVFDADGVFLRSTRPGNYLENRYGLTREKLAPFLAELGDCLVGKADLRHMLPSFLNQWGVGQSVEEFLGEAFNSGSEIDPDVAAIISTLRKRGTVCCLATNQDEHRMAYLDQYMRIREYFDRTYVSCEMGTKKPDHAAIHRRYSCTGTRSVTAVPCGVQCSVSQSGTNGRWWRPSM